MDKLFGDRAPALQTIKKIYKVCAKERVKDKRKGSKKKRHARDKNTIDAVCRLLDAY